MSESPPIVELTDVSFSYDGAAALENVSMRIDERDFAFLLGPNGGGKTTLLLLMLGLLKPDRGTVRLFGRSPSRTCGRVGYMPQHITFDPGFPVTVEGVALMGRLGVGGPRIRYGARDRKAVREALELVDMADMAKRRYAALSGGQRQRALIARALASHPDLLLLDEPTSNIDLHGESEFSALLERLNERLAVLVVSHDIGFTPKAVRKVFCVNRTLVCHPTNRITPEILREVYGEDIHIVIHAERDE